MTKVTTVKGSNGRRYEVTSLLYGSRNWVHNLYYGGIFLAGTGRKGPRGESSTSMEVTIERANARADELGIEITEK